MNKMTVVVLLALMIISYIGCSADTRDAQEQRPKVWMIPPPWSEGACLKELVKFESQWKQTRARIDGIGYYLWLLNHQFSDKELKALFRKVNDWGLEFSLEVPVVKGADWGFKDPLNADTAFAKYQQLTKRFEADGMKSVDVVSFDEPVFASAHPIPAQVTQGLLPKGGGLPSQELTVKERMAYGIEQTAAFIGMMRKSHPGTMLGDIEPYPTLSYEEITYAIDGIQKACLEKDIKGLEFFRLDFDWASMSTSNRGSWSEVKKIEEFCHSKGIRFGMIYWAPDHEFLMLKGIDHPMAWYVGMMHHGSAYALVNGKPDEYVLQSWMHIPLHAVPESDITTFSRSVLDFCKSFVDKEIK
ncbi:MAG: hypothetical protein ACYC1M_05105 [Armatimonadota bacterium]